jgi:hypothetical protein
MGISMIKNILFIVELCVGYITEIYNLVAILRMGKALI